ncbi:MAG: uncharacterized protein JWQ99_1710 [Blastococcus sp.]|jgi:hypothetical protein|nr:uncharacterized protein [Blastococcus sp.]
MQAGSPRSGVRGRLLAAGGVLGAALVLGSALPAAAEEAGAAAAPATRPSVVPRCQITDPRLTELSGLVDVGDRVLAINDGGDTVAVYALDGTCQVVDVHTVPVDPYDPEDMAVGADGTVWLADTGDNTGSRPTVALHALRPDGSTGLFRLTYPDGPHDTEAMLLAPDGTPYLVTKEVLGASGVYRPSSGLVDGGTIALAKVAAVNFALTGTAGGPVGRAGQLMVTGGAVARDGRHLALRTYTDAYVWPLAGSDVPSALASRATRIPLPPSPQGEAISFTADNKQLEVASEGSPTDLTLIPIPAVAAAAAAPAQAGPVPSLTDFTSSGLSPITTGFIAAAVATIVVWLGGKLRRKP